MGGESAAQGGGHVEFPADLQAELDTIEHGTGGPVRLGNAGNCSEAQAAVSLRTPQDGRHGTDTRTVSRSSRRVRTIARP